MQTTVLNKKNIKEEKTSDKNIIFAKRLKTKRLKTKSKIKKDPTIRLQKLVDESDNTSYGPMSVDDFISEMKKW